MRPEIIAKLMALNEDDCSVRSITTADYSKELQEQRKQLVTYMTEARAKRHKVILSSKKLIIDDESYTIEQIKERMKCGRTVSERSPINGIMSIITNQETDKYGLKDHDKRKEKRKRNDDDKTKEIHERSYIEIQKKK
ncbi:hypothetical protein FQA39_LY05256 [Lamprigera yunnana]|nr:hypothetical protein FQA39_LY05256 [Lamprigera yunnana]